MCTVNIILSQKCLFLHTLHLLYFNLHSLLLLAFYYYGYNFYVRKSNAWATVLSFPLNWNMWIYSTRRKTAAGGRRPDFRFRLVAWSWPVLKQHGQKVTACLGHNHRKASRAKRDTYPNIPQLPFHPLGALQLNFSWRWRHYDTIRSGPLLECCTIEPMRQVKF